MVSRNSRSWVDSRGPTIASAPSTKAVSVPITTPHPAAAGPRPLTARYTSAGTAEPSTPATSGTTMRRRSVSSPSDSSRRTSRPTDEEEDRHEPVVDPVVQVHADGGVAEAQRAAEARARRGRSRPRRVRPHQRDHDRCQCERGATGLGAQEPAQRAGDLCGEERPPRRRLVARDERQQLDAPVSRCQRRPRRARSRCRRGRRPLPTSSSGRSAASAARRRRPARRRGPARRRSSRPRRSCAGW